jgi:hypothetical protein
VDGSNWSVVALILPELGELRTRAGSTGVTEGDPNVWSGRALQEGFVDLSALWSCINVSGL